MGNDMKATRFLEELDNHPQIGGLVDCTSNFETEQAEMQRKSGIELTPEMWLVGFDVAFCGSLLTTTCLHHLFFARIL